MKALAGFFFCPLLLELRRFNLIFERKKVYVFMLMAMQINSAQKAINRSLEPWVG